MMNPGAAASGPVGVLTRDRRTALPLYVQLREALRAMIDEQGLRPGDRLPTETALEERFGVSRSTIRQAVGDLEAEGLLQRIQGRGTFVTTPKIRHAPVLTSFSQLLASQGHRPSHRLLRTEVVEAPAEVARQLDLAPATSCRTLERVLLADDEPVGVSRTWLPRHVLGTHEDDIVRGADAGASLYRLLADTGAGLAPDRGVETIQPAIAGPDERRLLGCAVGTPLLQIRRTTWTAAGAPVEWTELVFLPGRYEYRVELHRPPVEAIGGGRD